MKSVLNYHIVTGIPIILILAIYIYDVLGFEFFLPAIILYAFVYRPIIDKLRLKALGLYNGETFWRTFWVTRFKHYGALMFSSK